MRKRREKSGEIVKGEALFIGEIKILFYLSFTILPSFYYFTYPYYYTYTYYYTYPYTY
jgi:hypothetical protein